MVGMFVCLCLTSKKPSEREFFVPAGTDLGVKLVTSKKPSEREFFVPAGTDVGVSVFHFSQLIVCFLGGFHALASFPCTV
jgi:hypothetical protein